MHRSLAVFAIVLAACSTTPSPSPTSNLFVTAPQITLGTVAAAPLAGRLTLTADRPVRVVARTTVGTESWQHAYVGMQTSWDVPLLRFLPATDHTVDVTVTDANGTTATTTLHVTAPAVPAQFPVFSLVTRDATRQEHGLILFAVQGVAGGQSSIVGLDDQARVVWLYQSWAPLVDAIPYDDGTILVTQGRTRGFVIDMIGNTVRTYRTRLDTNSPADAIAVDVDTFHHELSRLPDGSILTLSSEPRAISGFPTSPTDPTPRAAPANVVSNIPTHFAADGTILAQVHMFDVLDLHRVGYNSFGNFWDTTYMALAPTIDFDHANAFVLDTDGSFIVSMRHQDAVMRVSTSGQPLWILGDPTGWEGALGDVVLTPMGTGWQYPYGMHGIHRTTTGNWLLFDNGVGRAIPPMPELAANLRYSRAVEYAIDEEANTVREVWTYGQERGVALYASIVGNAEILPTTGNVLIDFGGLLPTTDGVPSSHLIEVTHTMPAEVIFEATLDDDNPSGPGTRFIYRAHHVPDLYATGS
jgi:arylsulfate sulfotransferase